MSYQETNFEEKEVIIGHKTEDSSAQVGESSKLNTFTSKFKADRCGKMSPDVCCDNFAHEVRKQQKQ